MCERTGSRVNTSFSSTNCEDSIPENSSKSSTSTCSLSADTMAWPKYPDKVGSATLC